MEKGGLRFVSAVAFLAMIGHLIFGFYTMYHYGSGTGYDADLAGHIVGGDAYNYIIIGVRGVGHIVAALCWAVVGTCLSIRAGQKELAESSPQVSERASNW